tara:strand:- start:1393 stop:1626 length:234 start_codon:yes stop_codon:yes gene_type:complete
VHSRKVRVGDLIKRRWNNSSDPGIQIHLDFKRLRDYGIVLEVDHTNGMVKARFFNQIHINPIPVRVGYFDIVSESNE